LRINNLRSKYQEESKPNYPTLSSLIKFSFTPSSTKDIPAGLEMLKALSPHKPVITIEDEFGKKTVVQSYSDLVKVIFKDSLN
jgi:hypothetical protein